MPEQDYSCFLHPRIKSSDHPGTCPECGRKYTFPLDSSPKYIGNLTVLSSIGRGFYGATYKVENPRTKGTFIVKVVPKATYSEDKGYSKDFDKEIENHRKATELRINVPRLVDAFESLVEFGDINIECFCIQMDWINGVTLKEFKKSTQLTSNRIAQIAYDLFDFLRQIDPIQIHHNDLHDGNIIVEVTAGESGRLIAIDHTVRTYVIDFGSMSEKERSGGSHLRDITWIVTHAQEMIDFYWQLAKESNHQSDLRVLALLNGLISTCKGREQVRESEIGGYCNEVYNIVMRSDSPWNYPKTLGTPSDFYNAQPMPSYYAPSLFYDPSDKWTKKVISPGPMLLTGMRGCGKTLLLKSLHFFARAEKRAMESNEEREKRVHSDSFVGFFVSASTLLTDPKSMEMHLPNHKLILAFSVDLVRCLRYCELDRIGKIDYAEVERFCKTLKSLINWFESPSNTHDIVAIEMSIEDALLRSREISDTTAGSLNVFEAFDFLAQRVQSVIDIWKNKHIIYLLDDLSTRYLKQSNVDEVLSQLSHQAERFSFKISTETPMLHLRTGGGEISQLDRDYVEFDLGNEVIQVLKTSGTDFVENVLRRRLGLTQEYTDISPSELLGNQTLSEVALSLAKDESGKRRGSYWGIKALGTLSTGDVGDSILMFHHMLIKLDPEKIRRKEMIPPKTQDAVIFEFSERKLRALANQKKLFYDHAVSFAQASQVEMRKSYQKTKKDKNKKIRQYSEVFLRVDPEEVDDLFKQINELVESGVFVYAGATPRSKMPGRTSPLFLKLAYRKILGVTNLMPISYKDRFELSGKAVKNWLTAPTPDKLIRTVDSGGVEPDLFEDTKWDWNDPSEIDQETIAREAMKIDEAKRPSLQVNLDNFEGSGNAPSKLPMDIESFALRSLVSNDIIGKNIVGALGFEDRSVGTWKNILSLGKPSTVTMILYEEEGYKNQILEILGNAGIPVEIVKYDDLVKTNGLSMIDIEPVTRFVEKLRKNDTVLDITSMNKPLIYLLTSEILKSKRKVGIIHTPAQEYLPPSKKIEKTLSLLETDLPKFFDEADKLVEGELEPQSKMTVWQNRNPGSTVYLVCFMSLKYSRVKKLLDELPVELLDIIYPMSSDGQDSPRSKFAANIAEILVGESGNTWPTESNDHLGAFYKLRELYSQYSLESGINFEIGLTGTKMHTVAAGMLGSFVSFSGVYYTPVHFDPKKYTYGTGKSSYTELYLRNVSN